MSITFIPPVAAISRSALANLQTNQTLISNVATEQTLWTYTVPANTLGTTNALHLRLNGNWLNNSGAVRTVRIRVKYGSTTLHDNTTASIGANALTFPWGMDLWLVNRAATNSQYLTGWTVIGASGTGTLTTGTGNFADFGAATSEMFVNLQGTSAEDSTSALAFLVTAQLSTNLTTLQISKEVAILEILAP